MIHVPPLPLIGDGHYCVSGDVRVHASAAIAPGVLLQADPGSQLVISAGVCIGNGAVLHAHGGVLEVEPGVTLGSLALLVGCGRVGAYACIGSRVTLVNPAIEAGQMIAPGVLMGDHSRHVVEVHGVSAGSAHAKSSTPAPGFSQPFSSQVPANPPPPTPEEPNKPVKVVYGRTTLERLMVTIFPGHQPSSPPDDQSSSNHSSPTS